ncbi:MAG: hypothetical protein Q4C43_11665, partial [Prevotella sp.]|nr:hypothetical protein [Prevotella sp.]
SLVKEGFSCHGNLQMSRFRRIFFIPFPVQSRFFCGPSGIWSHTVSREGTAGVLSDVNIAAQKTVTNENSVLERRNGI